MHTDCVHIPRELHTFALVCVCLCERARLCVGGPWLNLSDS